MLVFGIGAGPRVTEGAEIFFPREVGKKTGNQNWNFYYGG